MKNTIMLLAFISIICFCCKKEPVPLESKFIGKYQSGDLKVDVSWIDDNLSTTVDGVKYENTATYRNSLSAVKGVDTAFILEITEKGISYRNIKQNVLVSEGYLTRK